MKLTPGMQQYMKVKNENPDCIILFRMGDFYETFFDDAKTIARELQITLTSRGKGETKAPLAGIPYHALDPYLAKLVKKGYKVGIVEQIEDPKKAKGLVKRDLVRIVTPGTVIENLILDKESNNYILSFVKENENYALSYCDVSTGEFMCCNLNKKDFLNEINRLNPSEIIYSDIFNDEIILNSLKSKFNLSKYNNRFFYIEKAKSTLIEHFNVLNLEGFGIDESSLICSCGALLSYIKEKQMNNVLHINKIKVYRISDFMYLDNSTIRNLELTKNIINDSRDATLLSVIDKTITPMGKRLLKKWITSPLIEKEKIIERLDAVEELKNNLIYRHDLRECLKNVYDIERLIGRVSFKNANPKDLISLGNSLKYIPKIKDLLTNSKSSLLKSFSNISDLEKPKEIILNSIKEDPSTLVNEGNIIREGYNKELDELRKIRKDARSYLANLEEKEKERTKIKSLKIRYNKVIGYFIEITKSNLNLVPEDFIRKQSQVNSERFVTEELKELELKILSAQDKIYELEYNLYMEVLDSLRDYIHEVQYVANSISIIDVLSSFSIVSQEKNYSKPKINNEHIIELKESRHPVIESLGDVDFITNDCNLDSKNRTMIITGPNMAGKSTYLRQIALSILMAQMGCFVPASVANICIVDRVFSRIGAYDDLVNKQSTFMVEMNETANILNNASKNSFVILDEIGRGTSTFDGVSLAWAIAEYLNNEIKCFTLFATHYHHLNKLSEKFEGINNYNISVDEQEDKILFLRKIVEGGTDKSYGIQVAKLAGLPNEVINCAKNVMHLIELEENLDKKLENGLIKEDKKNDEKEIDYMDDFHLQEIENLKNNIIKEIENNLKKQVQKEVEERIKDSKIYDYKKKEKLDEFFN
ncbi:MAG: DNA mismatch repair protein MutS [Candidatus Nanoarchaeia archaeon]|nr:DNA mismatch repair protein MutS [Candidatus Nanoarchaeia archaeon]